MQLYFFLLIIVSLSCGTLPPADVSMGHAAVATIGMLVGWVLLCHVAARNCAIQVRSGKIAPETAVAVLEKQLGAFRWLGLGVVVLCLAGFGLARSLDSIPILGSSICLQAMILLAPGVVTTSGTWSAEHLFGAMLGYTDTGFKNYVGSLWQLFRASISWMVLPVLLLLAVSDGVSMLPVSTEASTWISVFTIVVFVSLGIPLLIRRIFKTSPLCREDEVWVQGLLEASGLRRTRAAIWNTGGKTFNAMVAGFVPPLRTLLISDRLAAELPRPQLAMVILHEAAHLRRRHMPLRMLTVLPAYGCGVLATGLAGSDTWGVAIGTTVGILATMGALRSMAYRTEHDADVYACRLAAKIQHRVDDVPTDYDQAAMCLSDALLRVTYEHPSVRKPTWLHPGVQQRIDRMKACSPTQRDGCVSSEITSNHPASA